MTPDEYSQIAPTDEPETLAIMRMVAYTDAPRTKENGLVEMYRRQKQDSPGIFLSRLEKLDHAWQEKFSKLGTAGPGASDEGTEKCVALCEQLIEKTLADIKAKGNG